MSEPKKFKVGQKVAWVSQSAGTWKEKHGEVLRIVRPGEEPTGGYAFLDHIRPGGGFGHPRNHESYLIVVKTTKRSKPRLYWPRVALLEED